MEISGSSKKRKIICSEEDEEKQREEEAKMETFFALVRSMRETRERWKNKVSEDVKEKNRVAVWKPTFQLEDFAEEGAADHSDRCRNKDPRVGILEGLSTKSDNKEDDAEKGIDLKLSL
ncbi:NRR repressor homolog 3-like [Vicia villosa]|uniref:NRR repressor homolog 3-like n=1 Tax=Vicia villosa TaxID=3911 RepID=UPI00273BCCC3|nr:NRR repressor homolog 3-like [Vicia villosa]